MGEPGPTPAQLDQILSIAVRVPDHGKLTPWRLVIFEGEARAQIGAAFAARWKVLHPEHGADIQTFVHNMFMRAPLVIAVVSRAAPHGKIPEWEQQLSAAAVCYNIELSAAALGFASQWQSDWIAYDPEIMKAMGLSEGERIAGFIYIGTATAPLEERPRPALADVVSRWSGA